MKNTIKIPAKFLKATLALGLVAGLNSCAKKPAFEVEEATDNNTPSAEEHKCGEGKCGEDHKCGEGKCGH